MASVTPLGRFLRKVRIDEHELLKDMAAKLNISVAQLSAIELGKRSTSPEIVEKIVEQYSSYTKNEDINKIIEMSQPAHKIDSGDTDIQRELLVTFARKYVELSDSDAVDLLEKIKML
ncbi:TPA: helix-turn-helix transcriptional regulator [Aeromonas salmonicida]|nr:helix-turn-helix transcriptional regulator [Aeromonas salmonicida]